MPSYLSALVLAQFLAIAAALAAVVWRRIPTPVFALYLACELGFGLVSVWAQGQSRLAVDIWYFSQFLSAALWVGCFWEIRRLVVADYPGIGSFATWTVAASLALGFGAIWLTAVDDRSLIGRFAIFVPRVVSGVLFVGMALLGVMVRHYAADHQPNILTHAKLFCFLMGSQAVSLWSLNLSPKSMVLSVTIAKMVLYLMCMLGWFFLTVAHRPINFPATADASDLRKAQERSQNAIAELEEVLGEDGRR